jgi:hypothetical protein
VVIAAVEWGPAAAWAAATATFTVALVALLASFGVFDTFRAARLRITFEQREPWCRTATLHDGSHALWVRVGVENAGRQPARGCVGRLVNLTTDGSFREDIDPLQLRWAGVPRSKAFDPIDLRRGQREFLDVLFLQERARWRIVTFDDPDFDPGFSTELTSHQQQVLDIAVFADNTRTPTRSLVAKVGAQDDPIVLQLA